MSIRTLLVRTLVATTVVVFASCSTDELTQQGWELVNKNASAFTSPAEVMATVGCVPLAGALKKGTVGVQTPTGHLLQFTCTGILGDSVRRALGTVRQLYAEGVFPPSVQQGEEPPPDIEPGVGDGYWFWIYLGSDEICVETTYSTWYTADHVNFKLMSRYTEIGDCWTVDTYAVVWIQNEHPDAPIPEEIPGGPYDPPQSPPPPPPPPPLSNDTICKAASKDSVLHITETGDSLNFGVLAAKQFQDTLRALLLASYGTVAEPNSEPLSELGGVVYRMPGSDSLIFKRLEGDATSDNCHYAPGSTSLPEGAVVVAYFHTHPYRDPGPAVQCRHSPNSNIPNTPRRMFNHQNGGGSDDDWDAATILGIPVYAIDPDVVYRLNPGVPKENFARSKNRPNGWKLAQRAASYV